MKGKSAHLVNIPEASTSSRGELDYYNEHGNPIYAHMVSLQDNKCKHLIQFPISVDLQKVRNSGENSKFPTVLLKADTGADVNLMNSNTFDKLIQDRTVSQLTSLRMEAYGNNTAVTVLGKSHAFLRWKHHVHRQLFYVTNVNASPNLLSWDACYTLGVIKPCYSVETSSKFQGNMEAAPTKPSTHLDQAYVHDDSSLHCQNEGTERHPHLFQRSRQSQRISFKVHHWWNGQSLKCNLTFLLESGSSPVLLTNSNLSQMSNPWDMHPGVFQIIYRMLSTRKSGI